VLSVARRSGGRVADPPHAHYYDVTIVLQ
jgi:hypothetical protein